MESKTNLPQNTQGITSTNHIAKGLFPLTPVPFTGAENIPYSWGRIALYSGLAYVSYPRLKKLSYVFMSAAALSAATSLTSGIWNNAAS